MSHLAPLRKNVIINGNFDLWQRGTTVNMTGNNPGYLADRFTIHEPGTPGSHRYTVQQSTTVPTVAQSNVLSNFSLQYDVTTAQSPYNGSNYSALGYVIEGYDWKSLAQRNFTISFWVRSTKTGTYSIGMYNTAGDRSYVTTYAINSSDTWEKKIITVTASPSAGTWNYTNSRGLIVEFVLGGLIAGSEETSTLNSWQSAFKVYSTTQANFFDNVANNFFITQVQIESGNIATDFEELPIQQIISLCERYYEKSYAITTAPGTNTTVGQQRVAATQTDTTTVFSDMVPYRVEKLSGGTVTLYLNAGTAGSWTWRSVASVDTNRTTTVALANSHGFMVSQTAALEYHAFGQWTSEDDFALS